MSGGVTSGLISRYCFPLLTLALVAVWGDADWGLAQVGPPVPSRATAEDSIEVLASSRSRQADFERIRRRYLPLGRSSNGGRCDERIGRFCLTHEDGTDWKIPPEHREIVSARIELVAQLTSARSRLPGDEWINGQLIRYLSESRRHGEAIAAAGECRAATAWCRALLGFALHYAGRPGEAEAAFDSALRELGEDERTRWADLSLLLDGAAAGAYRRLSPSDRTAFEARFWTLADPFFTRAGNETRSEHFARHVRQRLQERAESPEGGSWSADQREVLMRYGWPLGWERVEASPGQLGPPPLIAHLGSSPFSLVPPADALLGMVPGTDWDARDPAPRVEYEVPLLDSIATWIFPLDHQFAVFHHEASPVLIAAWALPSDSTPVDVRVRSALGMVSFDRPVVAPGPVPQESVGRRGVHMASIPVDSGIVASLELLLPETRRLARARRFVPPHPAPAGPHLSDLLIIDATEPLPDSLPAALPKARGSTSVMAGEEIGVYWELYGVARAGSPTITVNLRFAPTGSTGILRRIAQRIGLAREANPVRLEWEETVSDGPVLARSITLRIPLAAEGAYNLELTATRPNGPAIVASRSIHVIRR